MPPSSLCLSVAMGFLIQPVTYAQAGARADLLPAALGDRGTKVPGVGLSRGCWCVPGAVSWHEPGRGAEPSAPHGTGSRNQVLAGA